MNLNKKSRKQKTEEKINDLVIQLTNSGRDFKKSFVEGYYKLFKICFVSFLFNVLLFFSTIILLTVVF